LDDGLNPGARNTQGASVNAKFQVKEPRQTSRRDSGENPLTFREKRHRSADRIPRQSLITDRAKPLSDLIILSNSGAFEILVHLAKRQLRKILQRETVYLVVRQRRSPTERVAIFTRDETIILY
jgi:hypothetical protein